MKKNIYLNHFEHFDFLVEWVYLFLGKSFVSPISSNLGIYSKSKEIMMMTLIILNISVSKFVDRMN